VSRPNPPRSIGAEEKLARRIADERNLRGWTYERIAEAMTAAGCPIQGSAIFKIERGEPRRKINVDELVALSRIWAIPVGKLLDEE
jgi:transcriptional regulator with XRE-family HTH domain